jgi:hypothetical protein
MNTLFAAGTVGTVFFIERWGRRNILLYSAVVLTVCLTIFVAMIGLPNPTNATQWVAVGAILVYNSVFGFGWIGVPWLYGPEVRMYPGILVLRLRLTRACRSPLSNFVTQVVQRVPSANGYSPSSPSSQAASPSPMSAGRFGSG